MSVASATIAVEAEEDCEDFGPQLIAKLEVNNCNKNFSNK